MKRIALMIILGMTVGAHAEPQAPKDATQIEEVVNLKARCKMLERYGTPAEIEHCLRELASVLDLIKRLEQIVK